MQNIFFSWSQSHNTNFSFHIVTITVGWPEAVWIQSLLKAFYTWPALRKSNPRSRDLGSNALITRPCAPLLYFSWPKIQALWNWRLLGRKWNNNWIDLLDMDFSLTYNIDVHDNTQHRTMILLMKSCDMFLTLLFIYQLRNSFKTYQMCADI